MTEAADDRRYYKYMSRATARIVLANRTLRWSTPPTLNDPFDNQYSLHLNFDRAAVRQKILRQVWEGYTGAAPIDATTAMGAGLRFMRKYAPNLSRSKFEEKLGKRIDLGFEHGDAYLSHMETQLRPHLNQHKLLCLSMTSTSSVMWAYYAEQQMGAVISFKTVPGLDSPWPAGRQVEYVNDVPPLIGPDEFADMMSGRARIDWEAAMFRIVFSKSREWAHEKEWRIFSGSGRNPKAKFEDIEFGAEELDAVIVGCRMPDQDRAEFVDLAKRLYPNALVQEAARQKDRFGLEIRSVGGN